MRPKKYKVVCYWRHTKCKYKSLCDVNPLFIGVYINNRIFKASDIENVVKKVTFSGQNQGLTIYFLSTGIGVLGLILGVGNPDSYHSLS